MGRASAKLRSFCLSGVATRIRLRPPAAAAAAAAAAATAAAAAEAAAAGVGEKPDSCRSLALACSDDGEAKEEDAAGDQKDDGGGETKAEAEARVVMVVVDRSPEAKTALQWALSHAVQSHDCLLLLDVVNPAKSVDRQCERERDPKDYQLLYAMKSICQAKRPEVHVEVCLVEGQDRGPTIVEEAGRRHVSLLVVGGPRRRSPALTWRLLVMWALGADYSGGSGAAPAAARIGSSVADYCIHHAACAALAVRRKGRGGDGYLLTTKRRKDFWLLA